MDPRPPSSGRVVSSGRELLVPVDHDTMAIAVPERRPRRVTEIAPRRGWGSLDLRELWSYRDVLYILAWRDLKVRYRQTLLGATWVIGQPLLTMVIFTFLFNRVARIQAGHGLPYSLFVMAGLLIWTLFANAIQTSGNSLIGSSHLISKTYFPRLVVPLAGVLVSLADFGVSAVLLVPMMAWHGVLPPAAVVLLPLAITLTAILAIGVGAFLSALNVRYRDVRVLIPFMLQVWMYATPVVYPLDVLPPRLRLLAQLNPMTGIVEAFRACLLNTPVPWMAMSWSCLTAALVLVSGVYYFRTMERHFADIL